MSRQIQGGTVGEGPLADAPHEISTSLLVESERLGEQSHRLAMRLGNLAAFQVSDRPHAHP
ncbi:hypothetical protein GCM10023196_040030 [Actinoallomurus vinaceus]|uniref:Uncharacterized protein n=1 Tax=Actinoallomurus vinaceus TaxID=1080074 RepID=A0ABP8UC03_9ACTN